MKTLLKIIFISAALFGLLYYSMAQKAFRAERARMYARYQKQEVSRSEFDSFVSTFSLADVLKRPTFVLSSD